LGNRNALREFLYVDDLAEALITLLCLYDEPELINVGSEQEVTIVALATKVAATVGYQGKITLDASKPDGTPRKLMDSSRMKAFGWLPKTNLENGLALAYADFQMHSS